MRITLEQQDDGTQYYLATQRAPHGRLLAAESSTRRGAAACIYEMLGYTPRATWLAVKEDFGPVRDTCPPVQFKLKGNGNKRGQK